MLSQIVEADEGVEDENSYARLSELIALAEVGLEAEKHQVVEDDFLSQTVDELEADYFRRKAIEASAGEPNHTKEVVVEDWDEDDELLLEGGDD
jgi:molybdopterin converting factor small subunit